MYKAEIFMSSSCYFMRFSMFSNLIGSSRELSNYDEINSVQKTGLSLKAFSGKNVATWSSFCFLLVLCFKPPHGF